ncbi:chorismate synthase [soil metagenome]|jgi:chorismate synthase|nr:chorismate synthase [Chloroflexia bacterium]
MASTYGKFFRVTTWGESHGPALGAVLDGCPAGIEVDEALIQHDLDRRRVGQSKVTSPRNERDNVQILSGVFEGRTTGAPISLITYNADADSTKYDSIRDLYRPGHADYTYTAKWGHRDHRGGGRSSARETWGRVATSSIARALLKQAGIDVYAFTKQIGTIVAERFERDAIEQNLVRCCDPEAAERMVAAIDQIKIEKDSLGGIVEVRAEGVPPGLGEPIADKLDAMIGQAMLSIPATKGVEIGEGFKSAPMRGSQHNDDLYVDESGRVRTRTNHAGGMVGGISNGETIVARVAIKPTSSVSRIQETVDIYGNPREILVEGRHDPCVVPRAVPVVEAMMLLVLADLYLINRMSRVAWEAPNA